MPILGLGQDTHVNRTRMMPPPTDASGGVTMILSQPFSNPITPDIAMPLVQTPLVPTIQGPPHMPSPTNNGLVSTAVILGVLLLMAGGD